MPFVVHLLCSFTCAFMPRCHVFLHNNFIATINIINVQWKRQSDPIHSSLSVMIFFVACFWFRLSSPMFIYCVSRVIFGRNCSCKKYAQNIHRLRVYVRFNWNRQNKWIFCRFFLSLNRQIQFQNGNEMTIRLCRAQYTFWGFSTNDYDDDYGGYRVCNEPYVSSQMCHVWLFLIVPAQISIIHPYTLLYTTFIRLHAV